MQNFNYHTHTYRCRHADYDMSDEDYILEYIKMGFKEIAFTDHAPEKNKIDKRTNMRMEYSEKDEYLRNLNYLKDKYKNVINIKTGYEVEYLPNEEENIKELKNETDIIILGQHFVYDDNKNLKILGRCEFNNDELIRYANYIDTSFKLGIPLLLAHPDIFMLSCSTFGEIEEKITKMICESAEKYNIPLEINLGNIFGRVFLRNPNFNDLSSEQKQEIISRVRYPNRRFWQIASNYNIKVLYGIDAHFKGQILKYNELVKIANYIIGEDTINKLNFIDKL